MENRFGFKDLVQAVLLVAVLVMLGLTMRQYDRQWELMQGIRSQISDQAQQMARLRATLASGALSVRPADRENPQAGEDPFARIKAAQANEDYAQGDYLVQSFSVVPDRLTPIISTDVYASMIQGHVLEGLAQRDPQSLEWKPLIATGWEVRDNREAWEAYIEERQAVALTEAEVRDEAALPHAMTDEAELTDAMRAEQEEYVQARLEEGRRREDIAREADAPPALEIDFHIRRGVMFSDGEPVTADDVVFTYNWIMNPAVEAPRARVYFEKLRDVAKVDQDTVRFRFAEPYFKAFEIAAGMEILPEHFYSQYTPSEFNQATGLLLGSGPYRLEDPTTWRPEPGKPITLVRNDGYWGEPAAIEKLIWKVIDNDTARLTTFRNGELDTFFPTAEQYVQLKDDEQINATTQRWEFQRPNAGYLYIGWGQQRGGQDTPFADRRVRQAMTLLTDRARVIDELYYGYGQVVTGPFSPLTPQSNKDLEPWPFDPSRARELLAEAGYEDIDGDGVIETPEGEDFAFKLSYPSGSDTFKRLVLFLKDTYAKAGVALVPDPLEWSVLIERIDQRDFDAISLGWSGSIEGDPYQIFHSSQIVGTGDNAVSYANPAFDAVIEEARETVEEEKRMELWHEAHRILHEDQPYTFLFARQTLGFTDDRLKNVERTATGLNDLTEWYVPEDLQKWTR